MCEYPVYPVHPVSKYLIPDFTKSIVLITSQDLENRNFGTGFVVHRQAQETFVITCAHVIRKVGGPEQISIYGHAATQRASGDPDQIDVAVVSVVGLAERPLLSLSLTGAAGDPFLTAGFQFFDQRYLLRPLRGTLGVETRLDLRDQEAGIAAWDLRIADDAFDLRPGYSGSPVINPEHGGVLGVVSHKSGDRQGLAISSAALQHLWRDLPDGIFAVRNAPDVPLSRSAALKRQILTADLDDLLQKYEAAHAQLRSTLSEVDKITIKNRIRRLEQDIRETEQDLALR